MQQGKVQIRKEPTITYMADLGTEALPGPRIEELAGMLPFWGGFMAAILASCLQVATAQPLDRTKAALTLIQEGRKSRLREHLHL